MGLSRETIDFLRTEGWEEKKAMPPGKHTYNPYSLWMPPFGEGYNFFSDFGIMFGSYGYRQPKFRWVRVQKKIFRNHQAYQSWVDRDSSTEYELATKIAKEVKRLRAAYVRKNRLKGFKAKYNHLYERSAKLDELEKQKNEFTEKRPDVVLKSGKVYYICHFVDIEEVMDNGKNRALIDTIVFNLEKL